MRLRLPDHDEDNNKGAQRQAVDYEREKAPCLDEPEKKADAREARDARNDDADHEVTGDKGRMGQKMRYLHQGRPEDDGGGKEEGESRGAFTGEAGSQPGRHSDAGAGDPGNNGE